MSRYVLRLRQVIALAAMGRSMAVVWLAFTAGLIASSPALAQSSPDWTEPFPPFRIAGNLYYVGSRGLANYLITTSQGNILINSDLEANIPLIESSIEKLGFHFKDTKILLISHCRNWQRQTEKDKKRLQRARSGVGVAFSNSGR